MNDTEPSHTLTAFWRHEHGEDGRPLRTDDDVEEMIADLADPADWEHSVATVYVDQLRGPQGFPDHELMVCIDWANPTMGALAYFGSDHSYTAYSDGGTAVDGEHLYYYMGSDREVPVSAAIPVELVRDAVREFLRTTRRPTCVQWNTHDWRVYTG